jgi:hypothetical protein
MLLDVGLALGVAGATSLAFARLGQSTVLAWLAAGLVVGPYLPIPVFADHDRVEALSEFGVVLVMFTVGLELRIRRFLQMMPVVGLVAVVQIGALLWLGAVIGRLLGWGPTGSLFLGGAIAISSTGLPGARGVPGRGPGGRVGARRAGGGRDPAAEGRVRRDLLRLRGDDRRSAGARGCSATSPARR